MKKVLDAIFEREVGQLRQLSSSSSENGKMEKRKSFFPLSLVLREK
jgi:hypothetical protein